MTRVERIPRYLQLAALMMTNVYWFNFRANRYRRRYWLKFKCQGKKKLGVGHTQQARFIRSASSSVALANLSRWLSVGVESAKGAVDGDKCIASHSGFMRWSNILTWSSFFFSLANILWLNSPSALLVFASFVLHSVRLFYFVENVISGCR